MLHSFLRVENLCFWQSVLNVTYPCYTVNNQADKSPYIFVFWCIVTVRSVKKCINRRWCLGFRSSEFRKKTKIKLEHSNLPSKEKPPVDYKSRKFLLVHASAWKNFYKILSAVSVQSKSLLYNFYGIEHSLKIIEKCMSCGWVTGESHLRRCRSKSFTKSPPRRWRCRQVGDWWHLSLCTLIVEKIGICIQNK